MKISWMIFFGAIFPLIAFANTGLAEMGVVVVVPSPEPARVVANADAVLSKLRALDESVYEIENDKRIPAAPKSFPAQ